MVMGLTGKKQYLKKNIIKCTGATRRLKSTIRFLKHFTELNNHVTLNDNNGK